MLSQNYYHNGDDVYDASTLIAFANEQKYKVFNLPLAGIDISASPFKIDDIDDLVWHINRINNTSLSHPILLSNKGFIMDGWHRVCKAIIENRAYIKAIRFEEMPGSSRTSTKTK
jgi:hypothetical protein